MRYTFYSLLFVMLAGTFFNAAAFPHIGPISVSIPAGKGVLTEFDHGVDPLGHDAFGAHFTHVSLFGPDAEGYAKKLQQRITDSGSSLIISGAFSGGRQAQAALNALPPDAPNPLVLALPGKIDVPVMMTSVQAKRAGRLTICGLKGEKRPLWRSKNRVIRLAYLQHVTVCNLVLEGSGIALNNVGGSLYVLSVVLADSTADMVKTGFTTDKSSAWLDDQPAFHFDQQGHPVGVVKDSWGNRVVKVIGLEAFRGGVKGQKHPIYSSNKRTYFILQNSTVYLPNGSHPVKLVGARVLLSNNVISAVAKPVLKDFQRGAMALVDRAACGDSLFAGNVLYGAVGWVPNGNVMANGKPGRQGVRAVPLHLRARRTESVQGCSIPIHPNDSAYMNEQMWADWRDDPRAMDLAAAYEGGEKYYRFYHVAIDNQVHRYGLTEFGGGDYQASTVRQDSTWPLQPFAKFHPCSTFRTLDTMPKNWFERAVTVLGNNVLTGEPWDLFDGSKVDCQIINGKKSPGPDYIPKREPVFIESLQLPENYFDHLVSQ